MSKCRGFRDTGHIGTVGPNIRRLRAPLSRIFSILSESDRCNKAGWKAKPLLRRALLSDIRLPRPKFQRTTGPVPWYRSAIFTGLELGCSGLFIRG